MTRAFLDAGVDAGIAIPIARFSEQLTGSGAISQRVLQECRRPERVGEIERIGSVGAAIDRQRLGVAAVGIVEARGGAMKIAEMPDGMRQHRLIACAPADRDGFLRQRERRLGFDPGRA